MQWKQLSDETDPIALSGVSDFVADHEICGMQNGCSGKHGLGSLLRYVCGRVRVELSHFLAGLLNFMRVLETQGPYAILFVTGGSTPRPPK